MSENKRKFCQTSPENSKNTTTRSFANRAKIFKEPPTMPISDADLVKIKKIINESLDTKLAAATENLTTKSDLNKLTFELNSLRTQNIELARKVQLFEVRCGLLEEELEAQCRELKGKNIIFTIPNEPANLNPQEKVRTATQLLLGKSLDLPAAIKISSNNKFMKLKLNTGSSEITTEMLKNSPKLKNTGIFVQRDLTKQMQLKRRILLSYRKTIKSKEPGEKIQIKNSTLIVRSKIFYLTKDLQLQNNNNDGEKMLNEMFGELNFDTVKDIKMSKEWSNMRSTENPQPGGAGTSGMPPRSNSMGNFMRD